MKMLFAPMVAVALFAALPGIADPSQSEEKSPLLNSAMVPGGIPKKHIGLLFDVMKTAPSNILANADKFAEQAPYLDGVAIALKDVPVNCEDGSVATVDHGNIMNASQRWTRDAIRHHIPVLKEIAKKPHLEESFLLFWMTPRDYDDRLDWADDKAWANYAENMAVVAWLAKAGGMKGLMLDPEEYASARQYDHTSKDPPFSECAKLARQRGREVFARVFQEFPDAVLFTLWYFGRFRGGMGNVNPAGCADDAGDLLPYFYNGMLDVMPPGVRVVDGCEHYSLSATRYQYLFNANSQTTGALAFVAPKNRTKYRSQFLASNTHYLDMFVQDANPQSRWYHGPVDGSRLEHLRLNLEQSFITATEYIWIYGESTGKLFNWSDGHYAKQKTWEEVIPGMTETIMMVKDPLRWAAMRCAKLAAQGKLVNLASGAKPIKFESPAEVQSYSLSIKDMPSVKSVKTGERYLVSMLISAGVHKGKAKGRPEAACPRVIWRGKGKRLDIAPTQLTVPKVADDKGYFKVEGIVTVPDGADELLLDLAAELKGGEKVNYLRIKVCNAFDPVKIDETAPFSRVAFPQYAAPEDITFAAGADDLFRDFAAELKVGENKNSLDPAKGEQSSSNSKWVLNLNRRMLTKDQWKLTAYESKGRIFVTGNGAKTVGGGVLDLRNVKADTGHDIFELSRFGDFAGITALIAPDVPTIATRAFQNCSNLTAVVIGEIPLRRPAETAVEKRRDNLGRLGICQELVDSKLNFEFKRPIVVGKNFGWDICAKDVKPGELYSVGASMRRQGSGNVSIGARFLSNGRWYGSKRIISMRQPREDGVWRDGEVVVRIPQGADTLRLDIYAEVNVNGGGDKFEFDKFTIYKIGDPLPVWPPETLREKGQ